MEAIILVESHGDPHRVGAKGERGLMQIRQTTWEEVTRTSFGEARPWNHAFDPGLNREVGALYLESLQRRLLEQRSSWKGDLTSLLLASYNGGLGLVAECGWDPARFPAPVRRYVQRVNNLYEEFWNTAAQAPPREEGG